MKKLFLWIIIAIMAIPLLSCSDEEPAPPAAIDFVGGQGGQDDSSLNFSHQSSTQSVVFSSNYDWTATPSDEWIKVTPESGKAGEKCEIVVSLDANDTYEKRSGSIVINAKELNVVLTVSQEQNNAIILSTPTVNLPQAGGAFTVKLKANIDYEYEIKADWIKSVETRALTEHSLRFEAEANPSYDKREGEIVIKGDGFSETVTVTQAQTAFISLSTTEQNFDSEGGTFEVEVEHSVDYDVKISADWVTQIESRAIETSTLRFAVAENTTYGERKATITIKGGDITETITVVQTQNNAIILSTPTVNLPQAGGAFTVKLKANIDYEYEIKADWIKSVETRALTEHSLRFEAEANPSYDKREGEIVIKGDRFSETVTVTQAQTNVLTLSTTQQNFACSGGEFSVEVQHNVDYKVEISDSWITQIESRAVEATTLHFAVAENTTYGERKATITIKGGDITETITVVQTQNNAIILSTPTVNLPQAGGAFTVKLKANIDYEYEIKADWIKSVETRALTEHSLRFEAEANPSFDRRVGEIVIKGDGFSETVTVTQAQTNILTLSTTSQNFACSGGEFSVEVQHNVDYKVEISDSWITQIESRAVETTTLHFAVAENTTEERRTATITISGDGISETITIKQSKHSIPSNELRYTTTNGDFLSPYDITVFGANITSHTYSNGEGVIIFDAPITSIGNKAFYKCGPLKSITIPEGVTFIGNDAFCGCSSIVNINIPDSVTSIGNFAFSDCTSLKSVTIGNSVTSIGEFAFSYCTSLTRVDISDLSAWCEIDFDGYNANPAYYTENLYLNGTQVKGDLIIPNGTNKIGNYVFYEWNNLTSVTIPDSVTSIGNFAFSDCTSLKSVTIGNSVTSIGKYAFYNCTGELTVNCNIPSASSYDKGAFYNSKFTKVTIGDSVTSIGDYAFYDYTSLTSITIPNSVTSIGDSAFYQCSSLTSVTIGNSVTSIGNSAFYKCTLLTSVTIPDSVTSIGNSAFYKCTSLTSVTIGNSVTSIGQEAFYECTSLTRVDISDLSAWCEINFNGCEANPLYYAKQLCIGSSLVVGNLNIPDGTKRIGDYVFYDYDNLTGITIPDSVTSIGNSAFYDCTSLKSVTIGNGVTSIGNRAFYGCMGELIINCNIPSASSYDKGAFYGSKFTKVTIGDSVTSIGDYAFYECASLTSITIPNSVTSIGEYAFYECASLTSITIPDSVTSIGNYAFYNCTGELIINCNIPSASLYDKGAFYGSKFTKVTIGDSVTSIGDCAFYDCSSLTSITIPDSVTSIGNSAFCYCSSLTSVTIPDSVASIGRSAFYDCSSLTSITIPDSVTSIGNYAFYYCSSLTSITIPDSVTSIGECAFYDCMGELIINCNIPSASSYDKGAFYGSKFTKVTIGDSVTSIGYCAFYDCSSLTSVTIGNSVTSIGGSAFCKCTSLTRVTIGNSVTSIGSYAFYKCTSLTSITIPNSVTSIGNSAFNGCTSLKSVTIGNSVTSIGQEAFYGCIGELIINSKIIEADYTYNNYPTKDSNSWLYNSKFTKLTIGDNITKIGSYAFCGCTSLTSITIPDSVTEIGYEAFDGCTSLTRVDISDLSAWCKIDFGNLFANPLYYAKKLYLNGTEVTELTIPSDITEIKDCAFYNCTSLTSVTIGNGVTSIGNSAFYNCTLLTSVTIPDSVTSIGNSAFYDCTSLTSVTIGNGVTSIGDGAFSGCSSLTSVTIPDSVTSMGSYAFQYCTSLTSVYCKPTTPPTGDYDMFYNNASGRKIYVPTMSVSKYKSASYWSSYASSIYGYDF